MIVLAIGLYSVLFIVTLSNFIYLSRGPRVPRSPVSSSADRPPVSILIPARNEERNLRRLLPSIVRQEYPAFDVVVFDDQSVDRTSQVVEDWRQKTDALRITLVREDALPDGWIGKSYALHRAADHAEGELFLFLDADTEMRHPAALEQMVERFVRLRQPAVLTGYTRLMGRGQLLTSLVPFTILGFLPWALVRSTSEPSLGALNGQCWMIQADQYRQHRPHRQVRDKVLEDVEIGRYLKSHGIFPILVDVQEQVAVFMYENFSEAWRGFRKNAYLLMGGTFLRSLFSLGSFVTLFLILPVLLPWAVIPAWILKLLTDRRSHFSLWVSACAPLSFFLGALLQIDSVVSHLSGTVRWKGRKV